MHPIIIIFAFLCRLFVFLLCSKWLNRQQLSGLLYFSETELLVLFFKDVSLFIQKASLVWLTSTDPFQIVTPRKTVNLHQSFTVSFLAFYVSLCDLFVFMCPYAFSFFVHTSAPFLVFNIPTNVQSLTLIQLSFTFFSKSQLFLQF